MTTTWPSRPLADCVKFLSGGTPNKGRADFWAGDIPWVSSGEMAVDRIHDTSLHISEAGLEDGSRLVPPDTILAVVRGMSLAKDFRVAITTRHVAFNQDLKALVPLNGTHPRFLYYALAAQRSEIRDRASEASHGTKKLPTDVLGSVPIPYPDWTVQIRIADILWHYDDLIENNTRRIKLLEDAARLLYEEWFVRLRFPGHEHTPITDGVPKGWQKTYLGDHITVVRGKSYRSPELVETGGKPFVNLKCVARDGGFRLDGLKRFSGDHKPEQVVRPGDVVIAVTDMTQERRIVAHAARIPAAMTEPGVISMDTVKAVPHSTVNANWVYGLLRFSSFAKEVRQHATGTNVLHLKPARISEYAAVFPPRLLQGRYGESVESVLRQIDTLWLQQIKLQEARDLLLPRLMSGVVVV